jgi:hypothetical protein
LASFASNRRARPKRDRPRFFRARLIHDLLSHLPPLPGSALRLVHNYHPEGQFMSYIHRLSMLFLSPLIIFVFFLLRVPRQM